LATRNTPCRDDGLDIVGEVATATVDIESDAVGQAELRGTVWTARAAGVAVSKGQRCRVLRCEGLTLWVQPE
jgi:membrane protein implicated in regulation of membrane protease activity